MNNRGLTHTSHSNASVKAPATAMEVASVLARVVQGVRSLCGVQEGLVTWCGHAASVAAMLLLLL